MEANVRVAYDIVVITEEWYDSSNQVKRHQEYIWCLNAGYAGSPFHKSEKKKASKALSAL